VEWQLPPDLPAVLGHQDRLAHAFVDLVDNALRFAPARGTVRVSGQARGSEVQVHIDDDGVGLVAREDDDPFGLFAVGPRAGASASGANLGLFVAARLIESMGGRIWAEDAASRGRVRFALPRGEAAPSAA
jgi:signal transduction histidine kinase